MKNGKVNRDRKAKTLMMAGVPKIKKIEGKERLVYVKKHGMAIIKHLEKEKYGIINWFNNVVVDVKYDFCCYPKKGIAFVMNKGLWGIVNCAGRVVCPCEYTHIYSFKYGMAIVRKGAYYGLINEDGDVILKCKYTREQALEERRNIVHRM